MWTKLSADKKSELMKAYKKGGFSYRDMIDDYNNSYEEFEKGGKVEFNSGGETHVVYRKESPTGNGKGIEGHIMINHPTKDKGKWDTIDLTDISNYKVKTIDQGIASTKKWHAENPEYKMGGMIKRADGSYSKRGLWDNIRTNAGSGKAPTAEMLRQERRIKNKYEEGGKVNTLEGDLISKVIMNRNRDKDFVQRAYAVGEYPNSNMFVQPDANQFGDKNSHLMSYGEDDNGQSYMFPTIFNDKNEAVKVPNQYADYISSVGYKNATSIPTHMYGGIQKYQEGGIEESINKRLGNPMNKAEIDSDYKGLVIDPRTRRQHEAEPVDNVRHAAAGRYTQEAIENYANLIPYASAIPGFSKATGFIGSNVLGLGHEASTLLNKNDDDTRTMGMKVKESAADAYNNMIGSVIGASNLTPYQKKAYIKYLSETGKMPTGQYNKKKDPTYKKEMGGIQRYEVGGETKPPVINMSLMGTPNFASETTQSQAPASKYAAAEQNKAAVKAAIEGHAETVYNKHLQREELKKKYPTKNQEEIQRIQDKIESPLFYEPAGQLASYATRFHGLTDDEIARITGSGTMGDRLGVAANMGAWALGNEIGAKAIGNFASNVSPYIKKGLNAAGKAIGTEEGLLSNYYKFNPYAEKLKNANKSYRVAGLDAFEDFKNTGVLRSIQKGVPEGATLAERTMSRPTGFPSFQKGYADMAYAPKEGAVVFETNLPTFKRGEVNPVTGLPIKGRHYAHRVIDPNTGGIVTEIPGSNIKVFADKPHWRKGYQEVPVELPGSPNAALYESKTINPIYNTSSLPKELEPYLSKKVIPASNQDQVFESFLSPEMQQKKAAQRIINYDKQGNIIQEGFGQEPVKSGFDFNFITKPLTPFTKNELTKIPGQNMAYRKIGNQSGLQDLINKKGAQAPAPMRMKSGLTADTPFFGMGKKPSESYKGMYAVEVDPFNPKYNWSSRVAGTDNYGVAPYSKETGELVKNIPLEDLNVYRKKWFSNNYKKLDPNNLEEALKYADAQYMAENAWKWGVRGLAADQFFNNGKIRKNITEEAKKQLSNGN